MTFEPRLKFWVSTRTIVCVSPQMHWRKEPSTTCYSRRKNITVLVAWVHDIFRECVMSSLQLWDLKEHKRWSLGHLRNLEVLKWGEPRKKLSQRSSFSRRGFTSRRLTYFPTKRILYLAFNWVISSFDKLQGWRFQLPFIKTKFWSKTKRGIPEDLCCRCVFCQPALSRNTVRF